MKQILLATTALVMTAGVAAAEISFSGYAEMGIVGGGDDAGDRGGHTGGEVEFHNDLNLIVTMTSETDTGLAFGASVEISKDEGDSNGNFSADNEAAFISGAFGTLTMGEIDGAMDWAITENVGNPGSIGDDETEHAGYFGAFGDGVFDNQIARYEYSFGDFGVAISAELEDDYYDEDGVFIGEGKGDNYAVGLKYKGDFGGFGMGFGLGYQKTSIYDAGLDAVKIGNVELLGASVTADFNNGFVAGIAYTDIDAEDEADGNHLGLSAGYTTGAFEIGANYGQFDIDGADKVKGYGIAAAYDLGGGLKAHVGYGDSDYGNGIEGDFETYSVGVSMSF
ncbi:outer membrane protein OmpU [[Luteovulum] sphaeroides subsp. megalophilum]|uniref:porin n=1 Tax=Cereibacter sphaeroides TaxID=1063 RepID=UPI000B7387B5|nr:porin [Cereibacter sphaeroides]SNS56936.1 outer membrane protein OmpU [[Luteovulum] sphaeroides subsp. megalophilum]